MRKILLLLFAGLTLGLVACSGGAASPKGASAQQVTIQVSEFSYQPATIEVLVGQPVKLTLQNKGSVEHDWAIQKIPVIDVREAGQGGHNMGGTTTPDLHVSALNGKSAELVFTPTRAGTYQVACTVAGHKEAGMVGTLIVK
ncbi:MAG: cupredoxin domain-containing protein [Chloroflexi bacterium]|nr:cupredoxin domain-containing protein [Chloroflexota bacterium]